MTENRQIVLDSLPDDKLEEANFALRTSTLPEPGPGEVLCRTLAITIGAGQRAGLQGSASYAGAPRTGVAMSGTAVARVELSRDESIESGAHVVCPSGWQDYSIHAAGAVRVVDAHGDPADHLGVYGTNGLTAYFGLLEVGRPREGQTVVVSAAAGSVGHLVGQMAALHGCRTVGVTGSDEKCAVLTERLGFDTALNRKSPEFRQEFKQACSDGIDIYFDNTGGEILGGALRRMNAHGTIVCCGVVSQYDTSSPAAGPRGIPGLLINHRIRMEGFLVFDYADRYPAARSEMKEWVEAGSLVPLQDEIEGLEKLPDAFVDLLGGGNVGTRIVRVAQ